MDSCCTLCLTKLLKISFNLFYWCFYIWIFTQIVIYIIVGYSAFIVHLRHSPHHYLRRLLKSSAQECRGCWHKIFALISVLSIQHTSSITGERHQSKLISTRLWGTGYKGCCTMGSGMRRGFICFLSKEQARLSQLATPFRSICLTDYFNP